MSLLRLEYVKQLNLLTFVAGAFVVCLYLFVYCHFHQQIHAPLTGEVKA